MLPLLFAAHAADVTLPLDRWREMVEEIEVSEIEAPPPVPVLQVDRTVTGTFHKGVFSGSLASTFEVPSVDGHARVPVIDADTSIGRVLLDGRPTSLLEEGGYWTVGVGAPGSHRVQVDFHQGREDDRFARRLAFDLPPSGPTALSVWVPEQGIDASLAQGAISATIAEGGGTRLVGSLDARGVLDLSWKRRLTHRDTAAPVRAEARVDTLFTLHEALVRGVAAVDLTVLEGETDRMDLVLPEDIEVVDVTGDAVLQWQTEPGRLVVLLRYLADDRARAEVHFQFPVDIEAGEPVALRMPLPREEVPMEGHIGVQGPAGLEVTVSRVERATALTLRDLPPELTEMTRSPLLLGFSFTETPDVALALVRNAEVELTSTIIDDIQASTVLIEDGAEITKTRMRLRNNTRQYLGATLPEGAVLTHAFIDGEPVRPAVSPEGALLFPLRQSERVESGAAMSHEVRPGDTLTGIAALYFGSTARWTDVLAANGDQVSSAFDLAPGQVLRIPATAAGSMQESSFVVELAYKRDAGDMGAVGRRAVSLPALDVDAVALTWHLYLPDAFVPLAFHANLTRYSAIHYDPLRRFRSFLREALLVRSAWAGGYQSILRQRKAIYRSENVRAKGGQEVTSSFPFTGDRYRFERILPGRETPRIAVTWMTRTALPPIRWTALATGFALATAALRRRWGVALIGFALALIAAHHVLGVHRRLLWGVDLALLYDLGRAHGARAFAASRARLRSPGDLLDLLSPRTLFTVFGLAAVLLMVGLFPVLLSTCALLALVLLRRVLR